MGGTVRGERRRSGGRRCIGRERARREERKGGEGAKEKGAGEEEKKGCGAGEGREGGGGGRWGCERRVARGQVSIGGYAWGGR